MSLNAQQKRDKEARIQARKEIRDQKKKEIREEKRLNKALDSLRNRWEENGWKIKEELIEIKDENRNEKYECHFKAIKACEDSSHYICVDGCLFRDNKIDVVINASFYQESKYYPAEMRQPEFGMAFEQYKKIERKLKEIRDELNNTTDGEIQRIETVIKKVDDIEYRHGKHRKYHEELKRELKKTLETTKKIKNNQKMNEIKIEKKNEKNEKNEIEKIEQEATE